LQRKIYYEPMYAYECKEILRNIVNGTSIRDDMEERITERGMESMRASIEALYRKPLEIEAYMKENVRLDLPGYEETGREMAKFLFAKWEGAHGVPIDAVDYYYLAMTSGIDNKALAIYHAICSDYLKGIWGLKDVEAGAPPPIIEDSVFFGLVDSSLLDKDGKLGVLKLYYDFAQYCAYARALLQHAEDLLKSKVAECADDIKAHMDFVEKDVLDSDDLKIKINIGANDAQLFHVHPSLYLACVVTLRMSGVFDPYVFFGISAISLEKLCESAESDKEKASRFLKCLSDNTKQSILQLLKDEPLYGSQLAEKLNCTGANISWHMSALLGLDLVCMKKENNRVYFSLNKEAIHKHLEVAKGLFG